MSDTLPLLFDSQPEPHGEVPVNHRGFRLSKLEVFNWGTFDRCVHRFAPRGAASLLVGENGAGKSTLVDAMLTLLVRPGIRNYNVAAGAGKKERDEKTYIRGAYDRTAGGDGKPAVQYLRSARGYYSALLAVFEHRATGRVFTICQVLYLTPNNEKKIIYGFDEKERGIAEDLSGLPSGSEAKATLADRGFRTTESYKQYFGWMQRVARFRPKAMDVFNQTVAVKDVHRLDDFIREHMLEKRPWNEKVSGLLKHFAELSEAHRALLEVRDQARMLEPIIKAGDRFDSFSSELRVLRRQQAAAALYFDDATRRLLAPMCDAWQLRIDHVSDEIKTLDEALERRRNDVAKINHDIDSAGGARLQQLPSLIREQEQLARSKRDSRIRLEAMLARAGLAITIASSQLLEKTQQKIAQRIEELTQQRDSDRNALQTLQYELGSLAKSLAEEREELQSLKRRRGNLPESLISVRDRICQSLKLSPTDLPFVAELIAVDPQHARWEASIEQVLYAFARTLLVGDDLYAQVSGFIDSTRLTDATQRGQRLTYDRIGPPRLGDQGRSPTDGLPAMLQYRHDHPLAPYVQAEIQNRFDHVACETVEAFQAATGRAMTIHRHTKRNQRQHEKDDRSQPDDRRHFVLGWDNRAKQAALETSIRKLTEQIQTASDRVDAKQRFTEHAATLLDLLNEAGKVVDFDAIDDARHDFDASQLRLEQQRLEQADDRVMALKAKRGELQSELLGLQTDRDQLSEERTLKTEELKNARRHLDRVSANLQRADQDGALDAAAEQFASIAARLGDQTLTVENLGLLPMQFERQLSAEIAAVEERLEPIQSELTKACTRLLTRFPALQSDLDSTPQSLPGFRRLHEKIAKDDLPRHERRFKQRLNEKVLHEIGVLHGSLENEREEIRGKIELLNEALRRLDWRTGTFMRLEPSDSGDAEIRDFRRELAGCLQGTFEGTAEANEATFERIEALVNKLRDDANLRWREKVIDVRNWFTFAAREYDRVTGQSGSYYDGGTGQSGGEKGKLAFLVLVAAIAYQYDINPDDPQSDRFHFVMVDEMFSRSDDARARYALNLFERFGLQLAIVAPLDAKARVTEQHVGMYGYIVKDPDTHRSELIGLTAEQYQAIRDEQRIDPSP